MEAARVANARRSTFPIFGRAAEIGLSRVSNHFRLSLQAPTVTRCSKLGREDGNERALYFLTGLPARLCDPLLLVEKSRESLGIDHVSCRPCLAIPLSALRRLWPKQSG